MGFGDENKSIDEMARGGKKGKQRLTCTACERFFLRQKRKSIEEKATLNLSTRDFQLTLKLHALSAVLHS